MFQFNTHSDGLEILVEVRSFEACTIAEFRNALDQCCVGGARNVVVDLTQVEMIDSSAIGALLSVQKRLSDPSERVTLRGARPAVLTVIELLRLHRVFRIESTTTVAA
jgi:anti-sigma B factor antagonist